MKRNKKSMVSLVDGSTWDKNDCGIIAIPPQDWGDSEIIFLAVEVGRLVGEKIKEQLRDGLVIKRNMVSEQKPTLGLLHARGHAIVGGKFLMLMVDGEQERMAFRSVLKNQKISPVILEKVKERLLLEQKKRLLDELGTAKGNACLKV